MSMAIRYPEPREVDDLEPEGPAAGQSGGFLPVIVRWWWTLLAGTLLAAGVSYVAASTVTPTYEARAKVLVGPVNADVNTLQAATSLAQTYAELVVDGAPIETVSDEFARSLGGAVRANADVNTRIVTIRVRYRDQDLVAEVANALARELTELAEAEGSPEGAVTVVEPADRPSRPFAPQLALVVPVAMMAGLLLSLAVVLLLEYLADSFRGTRDLAAVPGAVSLGSVDGSRPVAADDAGPDERLLAVKVAYGGSNGSHAGGRTVLVAGVNKGDDGELPSNIATAATALGRRVVLLDASWPPAGPTRRFRLEAHPGLTDVLAARTDVADAVERCRVAIAPRLVVVPVGGALPPATIEPEVAEEVVRRLAADVDLVVVTSGTLADDATSLVWARAVDSVVVAARPEHTNRQDLADALSGIPLVGGTVLGTVLNVSRTVRPVGDVRVRRGRRDH
jgi:capsular polysaccharide biosynthesis protein